MPVYEYRCNSCDEIMTVQCPYAERETPRACCCGGMAEYRTSAPMLGSERKRGDSRLIFDERQVSSEKGERWRDAGTTGKEGGMGAKLTFDQGRKAG